MQYTRKEGIERAVRVRLRHVQGSVNVKERLDEIASVAEGGAPVIGVSHLEGVELRMERVLRARRAEGRRAICRYGKRQPKGWRDRRGGSPRGFRPAGSGRARGT